MFLPPESATMTAIRNAEARKPETPELDRDKAAEAAAEHNAAEEPWSRTDMLLAAAVDEMRRANWLVSVINSRKGTKAPKYPDPIVRPGVAAKRRRKSNLSMVQRMILDRRLRPVGPDGMPVALPNNPEEAAVILRQIRDRKRRNAARIGYTPADRRGQK